VRAIRTWRSSPHHLLPIVAAYMPIPAIGAALSARWNVGPSPERGPGDMFLRGTALTPPLFLPVVLIAGAAAARRRDSRGRVGAAAVSLVATAFLAGSTLNLPNDFAAARAARTPLGLTAALAAIHAGLGATLLFNALPRIAGPAPRA
jgi:hypothetical protein